MTSALTSRKDAIKARLDEAFPNNSGYSHFDVRLTRPAKHTPRSIKISWVAYPFEDTVRDTLGDLFAADVTFDRRRLWSCGLFHDDELDAWKTHEGNEHLTYDDESEGGCCSYDAEPDLSAETEAELRAAGETFESECRPGNYLPCPTCGGGAWYRPDRTTLTMAPCPDCARLGNDRTRFPGILDLDDPAHRAFFDATLAAIQKTQQAETARRDRRRARALAKPTTRATPHWLPLPTRDAGIINGYPVPTRDAGIINGYPVPTRVGCDYLTYPKDPERAVRCPNEASWFDPTTALRVCTTHKDTKRLP